MEQDAEKQCMRAYHQRGPVNDLGKCKSSSADRLTAWPKPEIPATTRRISKDIMDPGVAEELREGEKLSRRIIAVNRKRSDRRYCGDRDRAEINIANNAELRANAQYILTMIRVSRLKNTALAYQPKQNKFKVRARLFVRLFILMFEGSRARTRLS